MEIARDVLISIRSVLGSTYWSNFQRGGYLFQLPKYRDVLPERLKTLSSYPTRLQKYFDPQKLAIK
jgi:hypothetical protein